MSDYEWSDSECPKCGHYPTHYRNRQSFDCDDGWCEEDEEWQSFGEVDFVMCRMCWGTGIEHWCPSCGLDISHHEYRERLKAGTADA